ncbi:MAG: hypothetical protein ABIJ24_06155 [Nitrospinota bacterium]
MICKLTGIEGLGVKAHVIPKSFYLIDKTASPSLRILSNVPGEYPKKAPVGVYDKTIVTAEGEHIFQEFDDYACHLLIHEFPNAEPLNDGEETAAYFYKSFDYAKLKLFFMSMLWRSAASSHSMFKKVNLGSHQEVLRQAILSHNPGETDFFGVVLAIFDDPSKWAKIMDPFPERIDGIRYYRFYLANIVAYIKVDSQRAKYPFDVTQMRPDAPLCLIQRDFWGSREAIIMKRLAKRMRG